VLGADETFLSIFKPGIFGIFFVFLLYKLHKIQHLRHTIRGQGFYLSYKQFSIGYLRPPGILSINALAFFVELTRRQSPGRLQSSYEQVPD
jgi:hypothetical protein